MATEMKTLEELIQAETVALPTYLVAKVKQDGYHEIPRGNEVYKVVDGTKIVKMKLDDKGVTLEEVDPVVEADKANSRLFYVPDSHRNPYIGNGATEVKLKSGDNIERAMLDLFSEYVYGRNAFGVTIFVTDILGEVEEVVSP